ncbi:MAG: hypothetical protein R3F37_08855 [Candidatus Competibacteraceae bacterium]
MNTPARESSVSAGFEGALLIPLILDNTPPLRFNAVVAGKKYRRERCWLGLVCLLWTIQINAWG